MYVKLNVKEKRCIMKPLNLSIRELREDRDLTQKQVANALGIAQQYYSKYETGEYELPIRHLIGLSILYNLNTDYILGLSHYKFSFDNLQEPFLENITTGNILSKVMALNSDGRKALIEYVEFLSNKHLTYTK